MLKRTQRSQDLLFSDLAHVPLIREKHRCARVFSIFDYAVKSGAVHDVALVSRLMRHLLSHQMAGENSSSKGRRGKLSNDQGYDESVNGASLSVHSTLTASTICFTVFAMSSALQITFERRHHPKLVERGSAVRAHAFFAVYYELHGYPVSFMCHTSSGNLHSIPAYYSTSSCALEV